jgi:hypothetical protein
LKPIIEDIQKTMSGVEPIFNHHMSVSNSLRVLSNHFFDMGIKLRENGSPEQLKRYKEVTDHLVVIRGAVAQNFIHEAENNAHCKNEVIYKARIKELEAIISKSNSDNDLLK